MASIFWLIVAGYLLVGLVQLAGSGFRTERQDTAGLLSVFSTALGVGLAWPLRLMKRSAG
jgi:hypothetical protein